MSSFIELEVEVDRVLTSHADDDFKNVCYPGFVDGNRRFHSAV